MNIFRHTAIITAAVAATTVLSWTAASVSYADRPVTDACSAASFANSGGRLIDIERVVTTRKHQMAAYAVAHAFELQSRR